MQTAILNSEFSETVTSIKRESTDDVLGGGVSTTMALDCVVCGDRATGKHYGAISCDGCKGFFRRSVRKNPVYECRHQNNCTIDKDKRNQCRHCRWKKCIQMGMRKDAVQKERDRLGRQRQSNCVYRFSSVKSIEHFNRNLSHDDDDDDDDLSITALLRAEQTAREYIDRQIQLDRYPSNTERVQATLETIGISMNYQLRSLIEWAKDLKGFIDLSDNDKIALLRGHTGENLVLGVACRSLTCDDYLLLGNHYVISRNTLDPGLTRAAGRILDEIVKPLKEIQLDEKEYACLKAIVFFDQDNKSLAERMRVKELRKRIQVNLENYINQEKALMRGRFGELLLLMPPLQNIARLMVDLVARYNQDTKQVDDLINEMLLNRYRDDYQDSFLLTTPSSTTTATTTTSSLSPPSSASISKENDLDSNGSSLDTDMDDNTSQSQDSSLTSFANSILIRPRNTSDEINNLSLTEHDEYLSNIHLLHTNSQLDPILNHHGQVLQYFNDTSNDRLKYIKRSKAIRTPSTTNINSEINTEMNFLHDLVTPTNRQFDSTQINSSNNNNNNNIYQTDWNGRNLFSTSNDIKYEQQQNFLR